MLPLQPIWAQRRTHARICVLVLSTQYWTNHGGVSDQYRIPPHPIYTMYISRDFEIEQKNDQVKMI